MTPKAEALRILMSAVTAPKRTEIVALDCAIGRVLAEDLFSDIDMPPFNRSAMDGFAVRSADIEKTPVDLRVLETVKAGDVPTLAVQPGTATRIMTGAPVPEGADAVIMVEWTEALGPDRVRMQKSVGRGTNVSKKGEDMTRGERILARGLPIRPVEIGCLAAIGKAEVQVFCRPTLGVIATGDELLEPGKGVPTGGMIRETNGRMLVAQALSLGVGLDAEYLGIARDTRESVREHLEKGFAKDVLILSGGVSMGDYDFVHVELKARGLEVLLEKVAIKPGKPLLFGKITRPDGSIGWVFGLPGNPMSSFCTFEIFVRPFLRALMGRSGPHTLDLKARLLAPIDAKPMPRTQHIPARITFQDSGLVAETVPWHGSGDLRGMIDANGFVIVDANARPNAPGEIVDVFLLEPDVLRLAPARSRHATEETVG